MQKQFTCRGKAHSDSIEAYAQEQLNKVDRFLEHEREPIFLHIIFDAARTHNNHIVEAHLKSPHYDIHVEKEGPEFYKLINEVIDVLYFSLQKAKQERVDKEQEGLHRPG